MNRNEACVVGTKQSIGSRMSEELNELVNRMDILADRINNKLDPVMRMESPQVESCSKSMPEECYPEYFDMIRNHAGRISRQIDRINSYMDRVEI